MTNSDIYEIFEAGTVHQLRFRNLSFLHSSKYKIFRIDIFHTSRNNHCLHVEVFLEFFENLKYNLFIYFRKRVSWSMCSKTLSKLQRDSTSTSKQQHCCHQDPLLERHPSQIQNITVDLLISRAPNTLPIPWQSNQASPIIRCADTTIISKWFSRPPSPSLAAVKAHPTQRSLTSQ